MSKRIVKYNPAFLPKDELVWSFVVRHAELGLIVQVLRENVTQSNQHVLVIGPRGTGKTMLVLRAVEEVRREKDLNELWYPLVFSEESYQVTTPGEFWLEALFHLGQQTGDIRWKQTHKELSSEQDEGRLRERALAQLMDFADSQGKRILLVVENFNMLLGEQISDKDGWVLRHTLLNEPRVMLLATATSRFEGIDNSDKPMFELFRTVELKPLEEGECRTLWASITGNEPNDERVRPIQILTGGNPRLLTIISAFASQMSLKELMGDLLHLVDEHTEYFKSHLDGLPPTERKVYLGLAELWAPSTAREVSNIARLNVNKTSSLLCRLMERGAVVLANGQKRTKLYQVAERMYNIYYLMRRRGSPSGRVRALVNFLVGFYGQEELVTLAKRIAEEACELEPTLRQDHYQAFEGIVQRVPSEELRERLIKAAPANFFAMPDMPASMKSLVAGKKTEELQKVEGDKALQVILEKAEKLAEDPEKLQEAEEVYREAISIAPRDSRPWVEFGLLLHNKLGRYDEAEKAYRKAIELDEKSAWAWIALGQLLHENLERYDEAKEAYRKATELKPEVAWGHAMLGLLLHDKLGCYDEAEKAYRKAIELDEKKAWVWEALGQLLHEKLERYDEAEETYRKAIELDEKKAWVWAALGQLLHEKLERYDEAEEAYRKAVELEPEVAWGHAKLGELLHFELERYVEAEKAYRKAIELDENYALAWGSLGLLLHEKLERYDEAEEAYRKAVELDENYAGAWGALGLLLNKKLERYEEAEEAYRKTIELEPEVAWGHAKLGELLHFELERYVEAEKAYRKAIELDENYALAWGSLGLLLHKKFERYDEAEEAYRKAIELKPEVAWGHAKLGELLHFELERYVEAEKAYRKAVELDENDVGTWARLGLLLHEKLERYDEAEEAYREAIEGDEKQALVWAALGKLLHEKLDRPEEAEGALRKAIEIKPGKGWAIGELMDLLFTKLGRPREAVQLAQEKLSQERGNASVLNSILWAFYEHAPLDLLPEAEEWVREAAQLEPEDSNHQHTMASVMCRLGKGREALDHTRKYLKDTDVVAKTVEDGIDLFVGLAATGLADEALKVLQESPSAKILEPLVVGLQLFVGEDVKAAAEIMEVGKDVVKKIEERRDKMQSEKDSKNKVDK